MKTFNAINESVFFTIGLTQHRGGKGFLPFMQSSGSAFIDALGEAMKPKVRAVFLSSTASSIQVGLYTQNQGRQPGRKREVPNTRKIGGLVVDESVAPACGLFEYCLDLQAAPPSLPTFSTPIQQIIRTDGKTWQALARDSGTDEFIVTDEYVLPAFDHSLQWVMPMQGGALFDVPQGLYEFIEFLRRDMISIKDEEVFPKRIASYGRELVYWLMAAEDAPRLERFVYEFCPSHSLYIGTLAPELQAAKILAYCMILDAAMATYSPIASHRPATKAPSYCEDWFTVAQCSGQEIPEGIIKKITEELQKNKAHLDSRMFSFCSTLWAELDGGDSGAAAFSDETLAMDLAWTNGVFDAVSAEWQRQDVWPTIINIGAGTGNCAVGAMTRAAEYSSTAALYLCESDPVALQTSRARLTVSHFRFVDRGREITFQCSLGDPFVPKALSSSTHPMIILCDGLPRFPSGAKAVEDEFARRFDLVCDFAEKHEHSVISLRVPADFLDGKEYADMRQRLFASGRALWVQYDDTQERPKDKRLARAYAIIILDTARNGIISPLKQYEKVQARPELQFSLMPPRLSGGYLSWPALTELAAVPPLNGPVERRGMTLIDMDGNTLAVRVREYLSPDIPDAVIAEKYPVMMKDAGRFKAQLSRRKIRDKTVFNAENLEPYPFRPFDERVTYLCGMRPLFSDPAPDLQAIASIPDNWFLLATEGDEGIGDGIAAWASARPCDYDYFAGRSRHFPVWVPEAVLNGTPFRAGHGGREQSAKLRPKANLSKGARRLLDQLGHPNPDESRDGANLLWDFSLAIMFTPAYGKENQAALRLGWPRLPLPGWGKRRIPGEARNIIEEYAALGKTIRGVLAGAELEHQDILSHMATVRFDERTTSADPLSLNDAERTLSADWGIQAKGNAVRMRDGALAVKWTGGSLLKRCLELADAMNLPAAECLERLGENYADGRINKELCWVDIPGAAWDFTIGGRKVLRKWLSYRDFRVLNRPMTPQEMNQFSDIARRLVVLTLLGIKLDRLWPKLLDACGKG